MSAYPKVKDEELVGTYPAISKSGGGYVWDEVLEYRVWCHPHDGAPDLEDGDDYYYVFDNHEEALEFSQTNPGCEEPVALILQEEYIDEPQPGQYIHIKEQRITEWPVEFLSRPKRNPNTIPAFLSPNAPVNRLEILRGLTS
ncbi:GCN5 family acetyltransferase [Mucilaginibacter kameinonensis]|uniref:GCN5 family acetyltransferase n=1 Tax=Mucilaginibacter kameinonensis TaxID=452286 RepID=UPI000EF81355|nr:GCN5 family acetyltransferase [Mucilaginibacter kameinonensis]